MTEAFQLDPRLAADTEVVGRSAGGLILLMNDARWPWLILVPEQPDVSQLHELDAEIAAVVLSTSLAMARAMTASTPGKRLNLGALGNVVAQLHVHHVLRDSDDPAWPRPVWGFETRTPYEPDALEQQLQHWRTVLADMI